MIPRALYFTAPNKVEIQEIQLASLGEDQVLVRAELSAISAGSEMLIYRGHAPENIPLDENIPSLDSGTSFPLQYGYSIAGQVIEAGSNLSSSWIGRRVFSFHPHQTHFCISSDQVIPLPKDTALEESIFLPTMETALGFLHEGRPLLGERIAVFGQGIVGLLTTALLARMQPGSLTTFDPSELRRERSLALGASSSLDPLEDPSMVELRKRIQIDNPKGGFDLVYELSGQPKALDMALSLAGRGGRVILGSWYGSKSVELMLGGRFHRSQIKLISSQVSTIPAHLSDRWDKPRRFSTAWNMMEELQPSNLISHRYPFSHAAQAYQLLDNQSLDALQVVLTYEDDASINRR
jgi:2-desacetyl-2-hydroxyethyl bacteriochlorophyllide A dehydrogenase